MIHSHIFLYIFQQKFQICPLEGMEYLAQELILLDYKFLGICEEIVNFKGYDNHQIDLIYKGVYKEKIESFEFKGIEGDWINFKWIDVDDIDKYNIYPNIVKEMVKDKANKIYHSISNEIK